MRLPRGYHRARAAVTRNFWQACPHCRRHFGGHEWLNGQEETGGHISSVFEGAQAQPICPECTRLGVGCRSNLSRGRPHAGCPYLITRTAEDCTPGGDLIMRTESRHARDTG